MKKGATFTAVILLAFVVVMVIVLILSVGKSVNFLFGTGDDPGVEKITHRAIQQLGEPRSREINGTDDDDEEIG